MILMYQYSTNHASTQLHIALFLSFALFWCFCCASHMSWCRLYLEHRSSLLPSFMPACYAWNFQGRGKMLVFKLLRMDIKHKAYCYWFCQRSLSVTDQSHHVCIWRQQELLHKRLLMQRSMFDVDLIRNQYLLDALLHLQCRIMQCFRSIFMPS